MNKKQYSERDICALDDCGGLYSMHVNAMTHEGLDSKSDIAAELAFRDSEIIRLKKLVLECCNETLFSRVQPPRDLFEKAAYASTGNRNLYPDPWGELLSKCLDKPNE